MGSQRNACGHFPRMQGSAFGVIMRIAMRHTLSSQFPSFLKPYPSDTEIRTSLPPIQS
jgi:hypothetical protein